MSLASTIEIACPRCNILQRTLLYSSVNVSTDPRLKEEVLHGRVNLFRCADCRLETPVDAPLLYDDMERRFCIQYVSREDMESPDFFANLDKEGRPLMDPLLVQTVGSAGGYLGHPHYVFSMAQMRSYIVFRDRCERWGTEP